jgi:myo-inositol-1-phosphate synthase
MQRENDACELLPDGFPVMPEGTERRAAPRYPLIFAAEVTEVSSGAKLEARTADVSRTGCYIDTLNPIEPGVEIAVRLSHHDELFEARARVVYNSPGLGMGVAFVNVTPEQQARLDRWIAEETAQS